MDKGKNIMIISQYFYPEDFRINDIACELVKRGNNVTVVTGIPNYPEGKFYDGYGLNKKRQENYMGVNIIRLPIISRGNSTIRLAFNYLSFLVSSYFFVKRTKLKPDVIFTYGLSPMTQALIGPILAKRYGVKSVLYVLDLWPENIIAATGIEHPIVIKPIQKMVHKIYEETDIILASSKSFVNEIQKYTSKIKKVHYWPQYGEEIYYPIEKDKKEYKWVPQDDILNIGFTGNIGYAQGLQLLPIVAKRLKERNEHIRFVIVGDGRAKKDLLDEIEKENVKEYFLFIDRQPSSVISDILSEIDVAYISFDSNPIYEMTIPAKLQTYMACAKPILASASGEVEHIVKKSGSGHVGEVGEIDKLIENIMNFKVMTSEQLQKLGRNAYNYYRSNFDKEKLMDELENHLNL